MDSGSRAGMTEGEGWGTSSGGEVGGWWAGALATVLGEGYWGGAGGVIPGGFVSDHSVEDGEQFTHGGD